MAMCACDVKQVCITHEVELTNYHEWGRGKVSVEYSGKVAADHAELCPEPLQGCVNVGKVLEDKVGKELVQWI